jgi:thermitase
VNSNTQDNQTKQKLSKKLKNLFIFKQCIKTGFIVFAGSVSSIATVCAAPDKPWKTGQILVKPRAGLPEGEFENILKQNNGQSVEAIGSLNVHVVNVPAQAEEAVVRALSKNPNVEFAELDKAVELSATTPNDPQFPSAWHLPKIQATTAWDFSKADGIVIAILDSGVDGSHPDLVNQMIPGWNAVDGSTATSDINGHGTAVAGTAAAASNNATGVAAIAWNAKIMPVRITNSTDGYAYWSDVARGLDWAANNGADVANISYEVTTSSSVTSAAQRMRSKGGLVVVAAGNGGIDPGYTDNPYVISVSATTSTDEKASYSNYGAFIDVGAPGSSILTTSRGGSYGFWSGTSFASPATAGVIAMIMSANPNLTPDDIEKVLENSADKVAGGVHPYFGNGRINASNAVQLAMTTTVSDTTTPTATIFSPSAGAIVNGIVQVEVNAGDNVGVTEVSLYTNGQLIGTDGTAPYQFSWDTTSATDGNVTLTAHAKDAAGNDGVSSGLPVTVKNQVDNTAPTVAISNPVNGSKVSGGNVAVKVSATDNVSVASIRLFIDGALKSTVNGASLSYSWNVRKVSAGSHTIKAVAVDSSNNSIEQAIQVLK